MSSSITRTFTTESNYTKSDSSKIGVSGDKGVLKLSDNTGQTFTEDFTNDTGFTYDSDKAEFNSGLLQQKTNTPVGSTFYAKYDSVIDGNWGDGVVTGTALGGASIVNGKLDLTGGNKAVTYSALGNADSLQEGCIRFKYTPNYSGSPTNYNVLFESTEAISSNNNLISFRNDANGTFLLTMCSSTGAYIVSYVLPLWIPVSGQEYEFELNWDFVGGATRVFIDGTQHGVTQTGTGTRSSASTYFRIGAHLRTTPANFADGKFSQLMCFSTVQHTANYTPSNYDFPFYYPESKADLPSFDYSSLGNIRAWESITATLTGAKLLHNGLYHNGSEWVVSNGSYIQSNTLVEAQAEITTLPLADSVIISIIFEENATKQSIDAYQLDYTGQIYPTDKPWIKFNATTSGSELISFTESITEPAGTNVKYAIEIDGSDYYVTGGVLTASDGYTKTNTGAEIQTNIALFLTSRSSFRVKIYLNSDGTATPDIDYFTVAYDAALPDVTPTLIDVNGFFYKGDDPNATVTLKFRPYQKGFINEGITYVYNWREFDSSIDSVGFVSQNIPKNPANTFWEVKLGKQTAKFSLEDITSTNVDFADLDVTFIEVD